MVKRPEYTVQKALNVLRQRGATSVALDHYRQILEIHNITAADEVLRLDSASAFKKETAFNTLTKAITMSPFDS